MAKDFVVYRVHIHKVNQEELYKLLESMPKSTRGLYIREALEYYRRTRAPASVFPKTPEASFRDVFEEDFGGTI